MLVWTPHSSQRPRCWKLRRPGLEEWAMGREGLELGVGPAGAESTRGCRVGLREVTTPRAVARGPTGLG